MKHIISLCPFMLSLVLGITSAQAEIIYSVRDSGIDRTQEYIFSPDTDDLIELDATNTYVLRHNWNIRDEPVIEGKLHIAADGQFYNGASNGKTITLGADSALVGGMLNGNVGNKTQTLDGGGYDFSLQSGTLKAAKDATLSIINANLSGGGDIDVTGTGAVRFQSTVDTTGFTGTFNVTGSTLDLHEITTASFGLSLSSGGVYANDANAAFTSLTIMGSAVANGTYTRDDLLTYGDGAFNQDWASFITDGSTGTITVNSLVPEPRQYAFIFGLMIFAARLLSRAK